MATTVTAYVNTASVGGDGTTNNTSGATAAYASLNACLAARGKDLVASDEILLVKCSGSTADTTAVSSSSWASFVCDATRYVQIEPEAGQEHGGAWNTGVYRLETTDSSAFNAPTTSGVAYHVRLRGLQIMAIATTGSTARACINAPVGISVASIFDAQRCILRINKTGGTGTDHRTAIFSDAQWATVYFGDNLCLMEGTSPGNVVIRNSAGINMYVHNCGAVGGAIAYYDAANNASGTLQVKNCWAYQCTTFASGAGVENGDYNSTDLATATGGANDRVSQTFTFVNAAGGNYQPDSTDTAIKGHGVDLSADANLAITTDMNGDAVNSPPEIGPLNAAVGGGGGGGGGAAPYYYYYGGLVG